MRIRCLYRCFTASRKNPIFATSTVTFCLENVSSLCLGCSPASTCVCACPSVHAEADAYLHLDACPSLLHSSLEWLFSWLVVQARVRSSPRSTLSGNARRCFPLWSSPCHAHEFLVDDCHFDSRTVSSYAHRVSHHICFLLTSPSKPPSANLSLAVQT